MINKSCVNLKVFIGLIFSLTYLTACDKDNSEKVITGDSFEADEIYKFTDINRRITYFIEGSNGYDYYLFDSDFENETGIRIDEIAIKDRFGNSVLTASIDSSGNTGIMYRSIENVPEPVVNIFNFSDSALVVSASNYNWMNEKIDSMLFTLTFHLEDNGYYQLKNTASDYLSTPDILCQFDDDVDRAALCNYISRLLTVTNALDGAEFEGNLVCNLTNLSMPSCGFIGINSGLDKVMEVMNSTNTINEILANTPKIPIYPRPGKIIDYSVQELLCSGTWFQYQNNYNQLGSVQLNFNFNRNGTVNFFGFDYYGSFNYNGTWVILNNNRLFITLPDNDFTKNAGENLVMVFDILYLVDFYYMQLGINNLYENYYSILGYRK